MLVLSRKLGERIVPTLDDDTEIVVEVVEDRRHALLIGVTAPQNVHILREELNRRPRQQRAAV
jgi:carbon storage regulator CsrA